MNILPNSSSENSYQAHFSKNDSSTSAGFTLLQGHIQLMAMVPNLPENQLSPRWNRNRQVLEDADSIDTKQRSISDITPRLMPSASKYSRPNLTSIVAEKAVTQTGYHKTFPWHNKPRLPNLSIPTPAKPVTMPSFAKSIPGTKRMTRSRMESSACFPIIPNQSSYHTVSMVKEQTLEPQSQVGLYVPPFPYLLSPMGFPIMSMIPPNNYSMGSGDHNPSFYPHSLRCYEATTGKNGIFFPHNQNYMVPDPSAFMHPPMVPTYPQSSYATQSLPNFVPSVSYGNNVTHVTGGGGYHSYSMPNCNMPPSQSNCKYGNRICPGGVVLPPEPHEIQGVCHPVNSISMPDICMGPPEMFTKTDQPMPCNSLPTICGHEISVVVEDSASECEVDQGKKIGNRVEKNEDCSNAATLFCKNNLKTNEPKNSITSYPVEGSSKLAVLGPDSLPTKIPSNPRVTHSPVKPGKNEELDIDERICNGCCPQCPCCQIKHFHRGQQREDKKRSPSKKITSPRKTLKHHKSVVVAVHDCFPSDSSESECTDLESPRKSCFNNNNSINNPVIRKRKPRIDTILHKTKPRGGDSEEVFDELSDLSPDEVRLYTCEYLTELLSSDDWENCYNALQTMVRMARHRPKTLLNYLGPILWFAFKHLTSPKSALCRAAIVTFRELFQSIGSALDNDLEKLTEKLVIKSLAPNKFIREECDRALEAMVRHCSLIKVLFAMEIVSKKPHVRAACQRISKMTKQFVEVAGVDTCLKSMYAEKLLPMLFSFMTEANNETRTAAKEALAMLMNHLQFEQAVTNHVIFDRNCTDVFKKLDKMRGRNRSNRMGGTKAQPLLHYGR